ncbi:DUF6503 family protein [Ulvibacterium marinum]|uniref:Uncharacterized protein n=1 Tax=Ulvibacterium marinum TaxID=2419782 RepID=A0A3B0BZB5_9FLAO|nr:DUF6503 family protein [Ulvibacterium marinum]RKN78502.1 hypothetical protein D7Z94_20015 [Ulvibacterium marinum]
MKTLKLFTGLLVIFVTFGWKTNNPNCKNSTYILNQVQEKYDSNQKWGTSEIKLHIQEPRVNNPQRYTKLNLKNSDDYFEMERFREDGIVKRILTGNGESKIFLNGESELSKAIIEQYRLNVERSLGHKKFYKLMYGLPMSLSNNFWEQIRPAQKAEYKGRDVYRVAMELKDEMISKHWTLIIEVETYTLLAIEFNHPEDPGKEEEIITFEGEFDINGMKIPRIRNWYIKGTNEYLGTDIIVEELK